VYVQNLSSIAANIGTVTAGTINGVTINSSTINSTTINAGGGAVVIDSSGVAITRDTASLAGSPPVVPSYLVSGTHAQRFNNGATTHGQIGSVSATYATGGAVINELQLVAREVASQYSTVTVMATHSALESQARLIANGVSGTAYVDAFTAASGNNSIRLSADIIYLDGALDGNTFTPTYYGGTTAGTTTYTSQEGWYRRIGDVCFIYLRMVWTNATGTGSSRIGGLPFTSQTGGDHTLSIMHGSFSYTNAGLRIYLGSAVTYLEIFDQVIGAFSASVVDTSGDLIISGSYIIA
jgi:hypothetical protein